MLDELLEHLEAVARGAAALPSVVAADARSFLVEALDRLQERGEPERRVQDLHARWTAHVDRFADELLTRLRAGFAARAGGDEVRALVRAGMLLRFGLDPPELSIGRRLEVEQLAELAERTAFRSLQPAAGAVVDVPRYCWEVRLTQRVRAGAALTRAGWAAMSLRGPDLVRLLLALEVRQSAGVADRWRLSRVLAHHLHVRRQLDDRYDWPGDGDEHPLHEDTSRRLHALGVLDRIWDEEDRPCGWRLTPFGQEIVAEIAEGGETPFTAAAAALSREATERTFAIVAGESTFRRDETAGEAEGRQARMFAHALRNDLVPVSLAFDELMTVASFEDEAAAERYAARVRKGVAGALTFVDRVLRLSEMAARLPEPFPLLDAVRDAVAASGAWNGATLEVMEDELRTAPSVRGLRGSLVLAVVELLRNARREAGVEGRVRVGLRRASGGVALLVEDDGPGVAAADRRRVFDAGFTRQDSGTGFGLALARELLARDVNAAIYCEDSSLGGAAFVIRFPGRED